ncbi:MAG: hypothetical protein HRU00_04475 [Myxococcales bacterium]|nr:hypothetical protein [Myxococcales bacterium]
MFFGRSFLWPGVFALWLVASLTPAPAGASQSDPLEVPRGPLPTPELQGDPRIQLDAAAEAWRERGYRDLPVLAWASLAASEDGWDPVLLARAAEFAPDVPAIRLEVALRARSPQQALAGLRAISSDFPSLVWVLTLAGGVLGIAILASSGIFVAICFGRAVALLAHGLGHLSVVRIQPAWSGVLMLFTGLALLPLFGIGPLLVLAVGGVAAMVYLPRSTAALVAAGLALSGGLLGPPLERWGSLASAPARDAGSFAAWRAERGQPLPGDLERLEWALGQRPGDPLLSIGLASIWKRAGDLGRVLDVLADLDPAAATPVRARAENLRGIVWLARGQVERAVAAFEMAGAAEPSAVTLYNLSQAHGRALRLGEQTALYSRATELEPELIANYTRFSGTNVHRFLIDAPLPVTAYLAAALAPSDAGAAFASSVRQALLGVSIPDWGWMLLPGLAVLGLLLRRESLTLCSACLGQICARCTGGKSADRVCARCQRARTPDPETDAAVRAWQIGRIRSRQGHVRRALAGLALLLPGAAHVLEGRSLAGLARLLPTTLAAALCMLVLQAPMPSEIGLPLARAVLVFGLGSLALLYAASLREAFQRLTQPRDLR